MLVITRKPGEAIIIDGDIKITYLEHRGGDKIRIGIEAPEEVSIHREEVHLRIIKEQQEGF